MGAVAETKAAQVSLLPCLHALGPVAAGRLERTSMVQTTSLLLGF